MRWFLRMCVGSLSALEVTLQGWDHPGFRVALYESDGPEVPFPCLQPPCVTLGMAQRGGPANTPWTLIPLRCWGRGKEQWWPSSFSFQPLNPALPLQAQRTVCWESLPHTVTRVSCQELLWPFLYRISIYSVYQSPCKTDFSWD